jgi:hypothetical protein
MQWTNDFITVSGFVIECSTNCVIIRDESKGRVQFAQNNQDFTFPVARTENTGHRLVGGQFDIHKLFRSSQSSTEPQLAA